MEQASLFLENMIASKCPIEFLQFSYFDTRSIYYILNLTKTLKKLELKPKETSILSKIYPWKYLVRLESLSLHVQDWNRLSNADDVIAFLKMLPIQLKELKILAQIDEDLALEREDSLDTLKQRFTQRLLTECTFPALQICWILLESTATSTHLQEKEMKSRFQQRFPTLKEMKYKELLNPSERFQILTSIKHSY